ncbi:MAG: methionine synthase [Gemmiger sp.]
MDLTLPAHIDRAETLRYLGAGGWQPDAGTEALLNEAERRLLAVATPRAVWRELPCTALPPGCGSDLQRHLWGCDALLLMAATLGTGVDALLRRLELSDIALAAVADSMASVLLETVCDQWEIVRRTEYLQRKRYLTTRYAPGYGDCPLALNDEICLAVDTVRGCGLTVTPQHLLAPRKSMTAVLGVADRPVTGARAGCGHCLLRETCAYRKRGMTCEN